MIEIVSLTIGELETNCYLVSDSETKETIVIDPADEANFISEKIISLSLKPKIIAATHGHFDHLLAANELQIAFEIPFLIHKKDEKLVKQMAKSAEWWLKREIVEPIPNINGYLAEDSIIRFGKETLRATHLPGHTPGSIALYSLENKVCFSGDVLFENGVGRSDFSYSCREELKKSIEKIEAKTPGFTIYPGHGRSFHPGTSPEVTPG
ncbi:MBL fold metallo-hydrolase [Patescibacteria group bacterium]|nr:MBL fold metallo-hydrolase [Patescibacteria group bacterium]